MKKKCLAVVTLCFIILPVFSAQPSYDYVEIAYSRVDPDFKAFEDQDGLAIAASKTFGPSFFVQGDYNGVSFAPSGELAGQNADDWISLSAGVRGAIADNINWHVLASYQQVEFAGDAEPGYGLHLGLKYRPIERLHLGLQFGFIDVVIEDFQLIGELAYTIHDSLALTAKLRDYADWDYTAYEFGIRYQF